MSFSMIPGIDRTDPRGAEAAKIQVDPGLVLIVDESLPVRNKLVEILLKMGSAAGQILQAASPEEALLLFRDRRPRMVFAELVGMHPEDGLEVIHEMLEIDPATRVVLLTSESRESPEVRAAIRAGVFAYVEKPLRHEKIRAVLADLEAEEGGIERYR